MAPSSIYPTKIICPRTAKIVIRTCLFDRLDDAREHAKIIWIAAPGGSGKTTLISSYLEERKLAHCWYQIDEEDHDLATFYYYLGLAGKLAAPRRKKAIPKFTPEYQQGVTAFTRHFFSDLSSRLKNNGLIVLDNFQVLSEDGSIPSLLPCIAESLPEGVSLIVISRYLPPASMNILKAKRQLHVIDAQLIRFGEREWIAASQLFESAHSKNDLLSLHHKLDGWIAGLVLLPNTAQISDETNTAGLGIEVLDSYIADQFLSSLDEESSDLLLKVCYMPHITASSATAVSHIPESKKVLAELAQKTLFVLQQGDKGYTVHPLVKDYLKQRAEAQLSESQLHDLRLNTSHALLNDGEYEAAADLFLETSTWLPLLNIILEHASDLFDSGRIAPLERYINALPETFNDEPWINFWKGRLASYTEVFPALNLYESAYVGFKHNNDAKGLYSTWYHAVTMICGTLMGGDRLVNWTKRYDEIHCEHPELPKELQKEAVDALLLHAYFFSGENPTKRERLRKKLAATIVNMEASSLQIQVMANYSIVAAGSGVREEDISIYERLGNRLNALEDDPVHYLGASIYFSIGLWALNQFDKHLDVQRYALEVAKESGVSIFDAHIHAQTVIAALGSGNIELARKHLNHLKINISEDDPVYRSLYMTCLIIAGTCMDEYEDVDKIAKQYLTSLDITQIPPFIIHHKLLYIYYLCTRQKAGTAITLHDELLEYCEKLQFHGQTARFYLIYAKIFFDQGEIETSNQYLQKGFNLARQQEIITCCHWPPLLMTWACQQALKLDIETAYVTKFIEQHYQYIPEPDSECLNWPWPYRVTTFGNFEVTTRKGEVIMKQRAGKQLALLKALVSILDGHITNAALKEKLYIDANYEKASQSLDTQIHRLRKLFDDEQTVLRQADSIKLNLKYFWVDAREFESLSNNTISEKNAFEIATRLQQLYKGEYLPDDDSLDVIAQRERYRNMYLATLFACLDQMHSNPKRAITICQNALAREPLSEPLYRKLISIYLNEGNRDMAEVTLGQCRTMLKLHLESDVSEETLAILNIQLD